MLAPTRRSRLATRFQITVHWLLVAAGRTLAIVLLALAGTHWARSRDPSTDCHTGRVSAARRAPRWPPRQWSRGLARSDPAASAPSLRHRPPLRLLQRLLPDLPGHLHLVGMPFSHQPPGLQHPLRHGGLLRRRPPHLRLLLPDALRPGHAPPGRHLGQVRSTCTGPAPPPHQALAAWSPAPPWSAVSGSPSPGRVFGLKAIVARSNCSSPNMLVLDTSHDWPVYVSPGILLLLYYTVTSLLKLRTHQPLDQVSAQGHGPLTALRPRPPPGWELSSVLVSAEEGDGRERRGAGGGADPGGPVAPGPGQGCSRQGGGSCPGEEPGLSCGAGACPPEGLAHGVSACLCSACCPQPRGLTGRPTAAPCMT